MALRLAQEQQRLALQRQAWAVLIQAMWRGHFCRKNFAKILERYSLHVSLPFFLTSVGGFMVRATAWLWGAA